MEWDKQLDLHPGGTFRTVMQSPEGQKMPEGVGCYVLPSFVFTVDLQLLALPSGGTRYTARVMHADQAGRDAHAAMGFEQGWGIALDQLVALMKAQP